MNLKELAEEAGYEIVKGYVVESGVEEGTDYLVREDMFEEYWFNEESDMFFPNTKVGLQELLAFEEDKKKQIRIAMVMRT